MIQSRRSFLKTTGSLALSYGGASLPASASQPAYAGKAEFAFKWSNNLTQTHPVNIRARALVDTILQASNGRVELQVYPGSQLGSDPDVLSQVRAGGVDCVLMSGITFSTLVPNAAINGVGYAFKNYAQVWQAMDGELGAYVRGQLAKAGLVAMDKMLDNGFRHITTSTKPIHSVTDLKGLKIRVPGAPLWASLFRDLGAAPTPINFTELYTALQTKAVEGQENPLLAIETARLYEVQKYVALSNHMWDGWWFTFNARSWGRLPKNLQTLVAKCINDYAELERADVVKLEASMEAIIKAKGMTITRPDPKPFREMLRSKGFYEEWKKKFGDEAWSTLEKVTGKLA